MRVKHPKKAVTRKELNITTYLKHPSPEEILAFVKELGVSCYQFERFFGIPNGTLKHVALGTHNLPARYWHIIYEKQIPSYGAGIYNELPVSKTVIKTVSKKVSHSTVNNPLLDKLKEQLNP